MKYCFRSVMSELDIGYFSAMIGKLCDISFSC